MSRTKTVQKKAATSMLIEGIFPVQLGIYRSRLSSTQLDYFNSLIVHSKSTSASPIAKKIYHGQNILEDSSFAELRAFILESSYHFLVNTFGTTNELLISNSWLNISSASASQSFHAHANSLISGTFYILFDSSIHSSLLFRHPRALCSFTSYEDMPIIPTSFNSPLYQPSYTQGDLLLWPSYLEHGFIASTFPSDCIIPRVSLSFNLNISSTLLHSYSLAFS